jgi:E3 ubiquitin-protein ligase HERC3
MPLRLLALVTVGTAAGVMALSTCGASQSVLAPPLAPSAAATSRADAAADAGEAPSVVVAAGYGHTCVALRDGRAKCWGENAHGELGSGPATNRSVDVPAGDGGISLSPMCIGPGERAVAFGFSFHTICVVLASGQLKCFGEQRGPRGSGPVRDVVCGPNGATIPPVDVGSGQKVVAFASRGAHQCALLGGGRVKCWGENDTGQLGLGDRQPRLAALGNLGDKLPFVDLGTGRTARAIAVGDGSGGGAFSCALLDDGHLKCWGKGDHLGLGSKDDRGAGPGQMGDALPAVDLGTNRTAVALESGAFNTCVILDTGEAKCWGEGTGALGACEVYIAGDEPGEMGDARPSLSLGTLRRVRGLAVGPESACAILDNHSVKCWGRNGDGQLGLGDRLPHACGGMGDALPALDFGPGRTAGQLAVDLDRACAVLDHDEIKCWSFQGPKGVPVVPLGD